MRVVASQYAAACFTLAVALVGACERESSAPSITALTPETHEANFPISKGDHSVDCNTCHGGTSSFRQFSCQNGGCHVEPETTPKHRTTLGYEWVATSCFACHPRGSADGAPDHRSFFPIAPGDAHGGLSCTFCHQDRRSRSIVSCAVEGCHGEIVMGQRHQGVDGYTWTTEGCLGCHPKADKP